VDRTTSVLVTLVVYNAILIGVGLWARGRNKDAQDFFLAGRGLGPWVAAVSASASSSSAWTLLGVSGAAYAWGMPALWIFPSTVGGFLLNWLWVAPRLQKLAAAERAVTLSEVVVPPEIGRHRKLILRVAALIIVFCFTFYIASQFEAALRLTKICPTGRTATAARRVLVDGLLQKLASTELGIDPPSVSRGVRKIVRAAHMSHCPVCGCQLR